MASIYESVTDKIIQLIEENRTLPWCKPWQVTPPASAVSGRPYRGINALILSSTSYKEHRWLTFRQALDLGGNVRKGEKATQVVLWKFDDESEQDGKQKRSAPLVRTYSVFNVGQCENLNLAPLAENHISVEPLLSAEQLLNGYLDCPHVAHGGGVACYIPSRDRIEMPAPSSFISSERYFAVLAHELVHSSGAANRLARTGVTDPIHFGSETYALEELVAEIGAAFLSAECGVASTVEHSAAYIDGWLDALRRDKTLIIQAAGKAQRATDWILGHREQPRELTSTGEVE